MTIDEAEETLRRNIATTLGEERVREIAPVLRSTAEALALVMNEPVGIAGGDPDFVRSPIPACTPGATSRRRPRSSPPREQDSGD